jgi:hypothetical protein
MGSMISESDFMLVLRGWGKRRLRISLTTPDVSFGAFCTLVSTGDGETLLFSVGTDLLTVLVNACDFAFGDPVDGEDDALLGERMESGVVAVRQGFSLTVVLLKEL